MLDHSARPIETPVSGALAPAIWGRLQLGLCAFVLIMSLVWGTSARRGEPAITPTAASPVGSA